RFAFVLSTVSRRWSTAGSVFTHDRSVAGARLTVTPPAVTGNALAVARTACWWRASTSALVNCGLTSPRSTLTLTGPPDAAAGGVNHHRGRAVVVGDGRHQLRQLGAGEPAGGAAGDLAVAGHLAPGQRGVEGPRHRDQDDEAGRGRERDEADPADPTHSST